MRDLQDYRSGKPGFYPDQSVYAEYACDEFGLLHQDLDGGDGLIFSVASKTKKVAFGAGRCSWYPQNNATASTLASDKYFTNVILEHAGVPTLGGNYFFLNDRHRHRRNAGHEREDAYAYLGQLGGTAFAKPLLGSRGDFAQVLDGEAALARYLLEVSQSYDSILIQPVVAGIEYRIFLLDEEVVYSARKHPPFIVGDGVQTFRGLLAAYNAALRSHGLSPASVPMDCDSWLDSVLPNGAHWEIPGRMNLSAGGTMVLEAPCDEAAFSLARSAARAIGLRVAAVDLFTEVDAEPVMRVIEVNSNPSIRLLEQCGRQDLILKIWRHTFSALGLLDV